MVAWWRRWIPTKNAREIDRLQQRIAAIAAFEPTLKDLPDAALQAKTAALQARFRNAYLELGGDANFDATARLLEDDRQAQRAERQRIDSVLAALLPEAFAVVREASRRVLGLRHYDVQMLGGMVLHEGKIAEMKTGEGKTLVATLPAYLNALAGRGVHVVTVNAYLASRDAAWMGQLYRFLGLQVGVIQHGMSDVERQIAYAADITYGTNSEFGFDFLRDNMKLFLRDYTQRGMHYAIVDEVDSILIDEARTPLIISGPAEESTDKYVRINALVPNLRYEIDFTVDEKARAVVLTEHGVRSVETQLHLENLYDPDNIEILHHVNQGLRAHTLYRRDVDYMVEDNRVKIIDEFTGRVLEGRRWSEGLHQAVEAKEGVPIENENQTLATITYQNYFRNFLKLAGMTGTAETEAEEFAKIYDLDVVAVPTHRPMIRDDLHDVVYKSEREKFAAIVDEIAQRSSAGQPILVGTISVEKSEVLSRLLQQKQVAHHVLNAKYHRQEAEIIAQAGRRGAVTIATNMAGRGTDILLGGNPQFLAQAQYAKTSPAAAAGNLATVDSDSAYQSCLQAATAQCESEKAAVLQAGGLHILGTERHESRRIDNQLRGRAGRQGDPGSSRFYISLEDDLMRIFGGEKIVSLMERMGMQEGEVIEHPWVNKSIENAQRRVEGHNFDVRKHLLEYDDVMNDQRGAIYKLRRRVIAADTAATREMILDLLEDVVIDLIQRVLPEKTHDAWEMAALQRMVQDSFALELSTATLESWEPNREVLENNLYGLLESSLQTRETTFTRDAFYHVLRIIYLQTIDALWKDHLREMDNLREGISLRGYAQKDPKQEYKKEGFNLFAQTMASIAMEVVHKAFRVVITAESEEAYQARLTRQRQQQATLLLQQQAQQSDATPRTAAAKPAGASHRLATPAAPASTPKTVNKVGVNDLCPCGSGKKYKKCHMKRDGLAP